jgi:2-aminoadipate transaminase
MRSLLSDAALEGPPLAMPDAPAPIRFNFDAGYPAPEAFPTEILGQLAVEVLEDPAALGYVSVRQDPEGPVYQAADFPGRQEMALGNTDLRARIAEWLSARQGVADLSADNLILTSGGSQAVALAAAAFVNRGEGALVEALTFAWAPRSLRLRGADVRKVEIDAAGMVPESLAERLREMRRDSVRPKLIYLIPTHHLPTGSVMPLERRQRILELAEEWDLVVVEDAIYADLGLDGDPPPPSLLSLDRSDRVVQVHAFSKIVASGLRLGWACAPPRAVEAMAAVREDLGVSQWLARVMAEFLRRGHLEDQIVTAREVYRGKRDLAAAALHAACGDLVEFALPKGGIFLWVRLDESVDWQRARAEAARRGVSVRDAERFTTGGAPAGPQHFRLGYGHCSRDEIEQGTAALGTAISAAVRAEI